MLVLNPDTLAFQTALLSSQYKRTISASRWLQTVKCNYDPATFNTMDWTLDPDDRYYNESLSVDSSKGLKIETGSAYYFNVNASYPYHDPAEFPIICRLDAENLPDFCLIEMSAWVEFTLYGGIGLMLFRNTEYFSGGTIITGAHYHHSLIRNWLKYYRGDYHGASYFNHPRLLKALEGDMIQWGNNKIYDFKIIWDKIGTPQIKCWINNYFAVAANPKYADVELYEEYPFDSIAIVALPCYEVSDNRIAMSKGTYYINSFKVTELE